MQLQRRPSSDPSFFDVAPLGSGEIVVGNTMNVCTYVCMYVHMYEMAS